MGDHGCSGEPWASFSLLELEGSDPRMGRKNKPTYADTCRGVVELYADDK